MLKPIKSQVKTLQDRYNFILHLSEKYVLVRVSRAMLAEFVYNMSTESAFEINIMYS